MTTYSAQSIVFIDSRVPDLQDLLDGVQQGDLIYVLDTNSDGVQQIADILAANNLTGLASISIVAHGAPGEIEIGSTLLTDANLSSHSTALAEIGAAMAPGGNILLYGCDVGSGAAGTQFINDLSTLTSGTVVGAATHDVGSGADGGTWTLDASTGNLTQGAPFTADALNNFQGLLAAAGTVELWIASTEGGTGNGLFHADDTGTGTASNTTTLFTPSSANNPTGVSHLTDVALDTQDGFYFLDFSDAGKNIIVRASLSQALATPTATPTFTTIYSDSSFAGIGGIEVDDASQKLYFTELNRFERVNFDGTGLVTLGTAANVSSHTAFIDGVALDAPHSTAYFFSNHTTTTFTGPSHSGSNTTTIADDNGLYVDSNIATTGGTLTRLPIFPADPVTGGNNFPSLLGLISGIAVDTVNEILYFTTQQINGGAGGIYKYNLTGNSLGTYSAVWLEPITATQVLSYISVNPTTGKYYVSDDANGDHQVLVGDLSSTAAPTAFFTLPTGGAQLQPLGLALDNAPTLSLSASVPTWTEEGANVTLNPSAAATDPDNSALVSARVSISAGFRSGDVLTDSTAGTSITSSYNSSTGVLTLSGLDTVAHYQSVLDSVQYHGGENPTDFTRTDTSRTLTWAVNDGLLTSAPQTSSVSVVFVNDAPTLSNVAASAQYTEAGPATTLSSAVTVTDPDDLTLSSATVEITGGTFAGDGDVLMANVAGTSITASYSAATETLTLTGTDTLAHYQSVLDSVAFSSGGNPTNSGSDPTRTITWQLQDPSGTANSGIDTSTPATTTLTITTINDPPTLANVAASASFTEEGGPVTLSNAVSVSDPDNATLAGATVQITGGTFAGDGDVLAANTAGTSITANYNTTTETLTLTGSDTLAHYQSVLDSVTYNAGENPNDFGSNPTRTVTWTLNDGAATSNLSAPQTTTVTITNVNDAPTLSNVAASASFTEEGGAVALSNAVSVTDPDNLTLASATVAITGGTFPGDSDVLAANVAGTSITASYNAATETLTLAGSDTLAHYQSVLDSVTFNAGENPTNFGSNPTRTVVWTANDGSTTSTAQTTTVNITNVNDAPTLANVAASAQYTEEGGAVTLSNAIAVTDPDNLTLANATVQMTGGTFAGDADVLAATAVGNITVNYNSATETLTLSGNDTVANYQTVLDSVTFVAGENPNDFGSNPTRTVTWVANDGSGSFNLSNVATTTIGITNVNDAPTLSNVAASANFTQGGGAVTLSGAASTSDPDNLTLANATVQITAGTFAGDGDVLAANVAGTNITASYNAATELLTFTGTDTLAHYNQVLDSVTFNSTSGNPTNFGANPTRTVTWVVNDGSGSFNLSTAQTETINITNVNDAPSLTGVAASASYTEQSAATTLSGNVTVSDPDDTTLVGATVSITGGTFAGDNDVLSTSTAGTSITASYDSANERLVLSGTDTLADYQSVLDKVTFSEAGDNPTNYGSNPTRTISWVLNDGHASNNLSTAQTETLNVIGVNDQPTLANVAATVGFLPHHTITISPSIAVSDPDNLSLANATVRITSGTFVGDGDVLAANVSGTNITAIYNPATETLTLSGSDTLAHYQSVLDSVTFSSGNNPSNGNTNRTRTVTWVVNDGSGSNNLSTAATTTISIAGSVRNDFNGDGNSDLLLQKGSNVMVDVLNGTSIASSATTTAPVGQAVEAAADFNGDGKTDIVLQSTSGVPNGTPYIWLMNGTSVTSTVTLANPGSSWHIIAADDFNGDGNPDLLFQNTNHAAQIWEMNGTSVVTTAVVGNPGSGWSVIGAGDFNGDGNADILWQNNTTVMIWEMNGTSVVASATLSTPSADWHAIGTGDFNGDGMSDILLQATSGAPNGTPLIWEMNGTSILTQATLSNPGSAWHAIGTEDFNGDGMADILFQNTNATPLIWEMNGTSVASTFSLPNPGSGWILQDDGPIPANQMEAGANPGGRSGLNGDLVSSGSNDNATSAPGLLAGQGSPQLDNQRPMFGHA